MESINLYFPLAALQSSEQMWGVGWERFSDKIQSFSFTYICVKQNRASELQQKGLGIFVHDLKKFMVHIYFLFFIYLMK